MFFSQLYSLFCFLVLNNILLPAAAKLLQLCPTLCDPTDRLLCPWDSPGNNTGVGCQFLLQCMKVKIESEVIQSCLTLCDPMDYSPPGSTVHGIFQARVLEWVVISFSIYCHSLFILSPTEKDPSCFQVLATMNKADRNICV